MTDAQKTILVVDDNPDIGTLCRDLFEPEGYAVRTEESAEAGIAAARGARPDLVILDVMMEEVDSGFKAAQAIAAEHGDLPIIMLSGIADAATQVFDTSTLPIKALIDKPIEPQRLLDAVERVFA